MAIAGRFITGDGKSYDIPARSIEDLIEIFRPYGFQIGYLVFSWNRLHENLSKLFIEIVKPDAPAIPLAIWHSTDNDFAQRKMLREAIVADQKIEAATKKRALWILDHVESSLRFDRNDALHAPLSFMTGLVDDAVKTWVEPDVFSASPRAKSLRAKGHRDLLEHLKEFSELTIVLANHAEAVHLTILNPTRTLPDKPKLPHAHRKSQK